MSFAVSVYRCSDKALIDFPPEVNAPDFDAWLEETKRLCLYFEPLGADATVYEFWSCPAAVLGLPMLTAIYQHGLRVEGDDLDRLRVEIDRLEAHWTASVDSRSAASGGIDRAHLSERAGNLRTAIQLASSYNGYVVIG